MYSPEQAADEGDYRGNRQHRPCGRVLDGRSAARRQGCLVALS
jgi:hypothetical protein